MTKQGIDEHLLSVSALHSCSQSMIESLYLKNVLYDNYVYHATSKREILGQSLMRYVQEYLPEQIEEEEEDRESKAEEEEEEKERNNKVIAF